MNLETSEREILQLLDAREEWLLIEQGSGKSFPLRRGEIEIEIQREKLFFGFQNEKGFQTWRIIDWKCEKRKIHFELTRNFGKEKQKIELVPRVSSAELAENIEIARIERANRIAALIVSTKPKTKLIRVQLNQESGRFAQIILEDFSRIQTAALADVSSEATPQKLLAFALLWLEKLGRRKKNPVNEIRILAERRTAPDLQKLLALLRGNWQAKITLFEIPTLDENSQNERFSEVEKIKFTHLWRAKAKKNQMVKAAGLSQTAQKIIALAPAEIDAVFNLRGETLRFYGLPFARVRKIFGEEKAWFGIESKRRSLNKNTFEEFLELIENLKTYRRFDTPNPQHALYKLAPESWLEAILRRNIKLLDANLILSPVHNQFRAERDKIDLLAIRRDGRLVIIELKTAPDREMIFQAIDYWRKVELQRLSGNLQRAGIFGDSQISDAPALVYLVAPFLSFHRDFDFLAQTVSPEIEIVRFDLNENWREHLKVMGRKLITVS